MDPYDFSVRTNARLAVLEMMVAEALAQTMVDEDELEAFARDVDAEVDRAIAADKNDIVTASYRSAWDAALALLRRQFAAFRDRHPE